MCGGPFPTSKLDKQRELEYRAEDDHRTLQRASEVTADPARMKGVARHHRKEKQKLSAVGKQISGKRSFGGGR